MNKVIRLLTLGSIFLGATSVCLGQGQGKLMAKKAAELDAKRGIVESIVGLRIDSKEQLSNLVSAEYTIDASVAARVKGVNFEEAIYDAKRGVARVMATISISEMSTITGKKISLGPNVTVFKRIGFGSNDPKNAPLLGSMRAATLDAYKQLADKIVGCELSSKTKVKDFVLQSDEIKTSLAAAIYGAHLAKDDPYGWDEDGNAYVNMEITLGDVQDVLNQKLEYTEQVFKVTGHGAQKADEVAPAPTAAVPEKRVLVSQDASLKEGDLNLPKPAAAAKPELRNDPAPRESGHISGGAEPLQR